MIHTFLDGLLGSNTHVYAASNGEAMLVDCGVPVHEVAAFCEAHGLCVRFLVLTHGHYDHVGYLDAYREQFPAARVVCHEDELRVLRDPTANLSAYFGEACDLSQGVDTLREGDVLTLGTGEGAEQFTVLHTPGHTCGCMCLYNEAARVMFTGDVLFAMGYGRVDLPTASPSAMRASLARLQQYQGVTIYPGHGDICLLPQT